MKNLINQRKIILLFCLLTCQLLSHSQVLTNKSNAVFDSKDLELLHTTLDGYKGFYYSISDSNDTISSNDFKSLFVDDHLTIPRDFPEANSENADQNNFSISNYSIHIKKLYDPNLGYAADMDIADSIFLFCHQTNEWYTWVVKKISLKKADAIVGTFNSIERLKMIKDNGYLKITEIVMEKSLPIDEDGDGIADYMGTEKQGVLCDSCISNLVPNKNNYLTVSGCPANDYDGDGVLNDDDACKYFKGRKSKKKGMNGCPDPPSSVFGISLSLASASLLNNHFSDNDIIGTNAVIKPGYATKPGYTIGIDGYFNFHRNIGVRGGFLFTNIAMDTKEFKSIVQSLTANANEPTPSFFLGAKRLLVPNAGLRIGNLSSLNSVISVEATIGVAISDLSKNMYFDYGSVESNQFDEYGGISFDSKPFLVYGGKLNYEYGISKDGRFRIITSLYYLTGNYKSPTQYYYYVNSPTSFKFEGGRINLWGLSAGCYYNLFRPRILSAMGK